MVEPLGQHRNRDGDALRAGAQVHVRRDAGLEDRLLDHQDAVMLRGAAQEVLRTLPHEIPAQVREADQEGRSGVGGGRYGRHATTASNAQAWRDPLNRTNCHGRTAAVRGAGFFILGSAGGSGEWPARSVSLTLSGVLGSITVHLDERGFMQPVATLLARAAAHGPVTVLHSGMRARPTARPNLFYG